VKLSVIIPAYNEEVNLEKGVLNQVSDYLSAQDYDYEVLVVDDGSTDQTVKLVNQFIKNNPKFRLIESPHGGKAVTVMTGLLEAKGEVILFTDTDQATPLSQVEHFWPKFDQGFDIVIGSRAGRKGAPLIRQIYSLGFVIIRTLILGLPFRDTQCGFKLFRHNVSEKIFKKVYDIHGGFKKISGSNVTSGFDVEFLYIAEKMGYRIKEVPVSWLYVESRRVNAFKDSLEGLKELFRIRNNKGKGTYDQ
jgi:glycosyltransferase involved in cell wall biosynthesis